MESRLQIHRSIVSNKREPFIELRKPDVPGDLMRVREFMAYRTRARRMAPKERREQILESAVTLITASGNASCTLEQIAAEAGISKPLIYKYFPNREDLLTSLVERELQILRGRGLGSVSRDVPLEEVVWNTLERALSYYTDRGPVLRLLASEPAVAALLRQGNSQILSNTLNFFVSRSVEAYNVPEDVAHIAVAMVTNAPVLTMRYLHSRNIPVERIIDVWGTFVQGGWRSVGDRFGGEPASARPARGSGAKSTRKRNRS